MDAGSEPGSAALETEFDGAGESFESARPARAEEFSRAPSEAVASAPGADNTAPPELADLVAKVPETTRSLLHDLFKAEIKAVRRISRDQLR